MLNLFLMSVSRGTRLSVYASGPSRPSDPLMDALQSLDACLLLALVCLRPTHFEIVRNPFPQKFWALMVLPPDYILSQQMEPCFTLLTFFGFFPGSITGQGNQSSPTKCFCVLQTHSLPGSTHKSVSQSENLQERGKTCSPPSSLLTPS